MSEKSTSALLQDAVPQETLAVAPPAASWVDQEEILNWDAWIEVPPPRPHGTLAVRLVYAGRGKPTPIDDPETV